VTSAGSSSSHSLPDTAQTFCRITTEPSGSPVKIVASGLVPNFPGPAMGGSRVAVHTRVAVFFSTEHLTGPNATNASFNCVWNPTGLPGTCGIMPFSVDFNTPYLIFTL